MTRSFEQLKSEVRRSPTSDGGAFWLIPKETGQGHVIHIWPDGKDPLNSASYDFQPEFCTSKRCSCNRVLFTVVPKSFYAETEIFFFALFNEVGAFVDLDFFGSASSRRLRQATKDLFHSEPAYVRMIKREHRQIKSALASGYRCDRGPEFRRRASARN